MNTPLVCLITSEFTSIRHAMFLYLNDSSNCPYISVAGQFKTALIYYRLVQSKLLVNCSCPWTHQQLGAHVEVVGLYDRQWLLEDVVEAPLAIDDHGDLVEDFSVLGHHWWGAFQGQWNAEVVGVRTWRQIPGSKDRCPGVQVLLLASEILRVVLGLSTSRPCSPLIPSHLCLALEKNVYL